MDDSQSKPCVKKARKLSCRQKRFIDEYLIDLNGTQAALRVGYAKSGARFAASRLLRHPIVIDAIAHEMQEREQRTQITQDRVLQELARIAFFDIRSLYREDGTLKNPAELDDDAAAVLSGMDVVETASGRRRRVSVSVKKARTVDKNTALTNVMRHLGMMKDRIEHTGDIGIRRLLDEVDGYRLMPRQED